MRIDYYGRHNRYFCEENELPLAYITYEAKEQEFADKVFAILRDMELNVCEEEECASIEVAGRWEYDEVAEMFKEAKKMARRGGMRT